MAGFAQGKEPVDGAALGASGEWGQLARRGRHRSEVPYFFPTFVYVLAAALGRKHGIPQYELSSAVVQTYVLPQAIEKGWVDGASYEGRLSSECWALLDCGALIDVRLLMHASV